MRRVCIALLLSATVLVSTAANKATRQAGKAVFTQPGMELVTKAKNGNIRAWAVGVADSEMAARALAMKNATMEISESLRKTVESTTKGFLLVESGVSKEMVSKEFLITASHQLNGVTQIYDSWAPKDENGMYRNYVVLELKGQELIDKLYNSYKKSNPNANAQSRERLQKSYMESVNQ